MENLAGLKTKCFGWLNLTCLSLAHMPVQQKKLILSPQVFVSDVSKPDTVNSVIYVEVKKSEVLHFSKLFYSSRQVVNGRMT